MFGGFGAADPMWGEIIMATPSFAMSPQEDVMLDGVARQVANINQMFSRERLERAAAQDERLRLARELHDGVLQSLTGATLLLETLSRLIDADPRAAQKRLRDIEGLVIEEQRELVTEGLPSKAVAGRLAITEGTAKVHLHHV